MATFGGLDVLVNNAGTAIPKTFEETTLEEIDRLLNINVRGVFIATQAALKHMTRGGSIIMIGSAVGERVLTPGLVPYSATKGAVNIFTQALSRELGSRGITVNNVQPGPIDTDLNPATGDWAGPQKAASALDRYGHVMPEIHQAEARKLDRLVFGNGSTPRPSDLAVVGVGRPANGSKMGAETTKGLAT